MSKQQYIISIAPKIDFDLKEYELEGLRFFISGMSGSGKSNTAKVICEEVLKLEIPLLIIDLEGEYPSLKEKFEKVLTVGGMFADIPLNSRMIDDLINTLYTSGVSLIFDIAELPKDQKKEFSTKLLERLFLLGTKYRTAMFLVIEECHILAPQGSKSESMETCRDIITRGRKRGIHSIWLSQRTALVNKDIISQCNIRLLGKFLERNDIDPIKEILKNANISANEIMNLQQEFFFISINRKEKVKFRKAEIRDLARTPLFGEKLTLISRKNESLEKMIATLVEKAEKLSIEEKEEQDKLKILEKQVKELEQQNQDKDDEIATLKHDLQLVSNIKVVSKDSKFVSNLDEITLNIKRKEQQITALKTDQRILQTKVDELTSENNELKNTIEKLGTEIAAKSKMIKNMEKIKYHTSQLSNLVEVTPDNSELEKIIEEQRKKIDQLKKQQSLNGNFYTKLGFIRHPMVEERIQLARKSIQSTPLINTIMTIIIEKDRPLSYKELSELSNYTTNKISAGATALEKHKIIKKIKGANGILIDIDLESIPNVIKEEKRKKELKEKAQNLFPRN